MIKINIEKNRLDKIINEHYESLRYDIKGEINDVIQYMDYLMRAETYDKCISENEKIDSYFTKYHEKNMNLKNEIKDSSSNIKDTLSEIVKDDTLKIFLTGRPETLIEKESEIFDSSKLEIYIISKIFDYDKFSNKDKSKKDKSKKDKSKKDKYNAYSLAKKLNINTCLYCNRQYTFTVINDGNEITRPEFDHFFKKSKHPLLALSFYNLIPSCHICNSTLKGTEEMTLDKYLHPYFDDFGNGGVFRYLPFGDDLDYTKSKDYLPYLDISGDKEKLIKNHNKLFRLEEIYKHHADIIEEIIVKSRINSKDYIESLSKAYGFNTSEIYQFYFSNYYNEEDYSKRVLSKFTRDIVKDTPGLKDMF